MLLVLQINVSETFLDNIKAETVMKVYFLLLKNDTFC